MPTVRDSLSLKDKFNTLAVPKNESVNLSKFERTRRMYGQIVENVANLKKFKDNNFKDPQS